MPSIIQGYEYDIFISYRHNDNRSGWVTEFIKNLQEELAATIKDPVSVYFDSNPLDGLLETHNVDKSLEGKLKCLIFMPILSQTYCDPKSFAWQQEFCAFNKSVNEDQFGRNIKLSNGNVSSRILPIKIHDLDGEDKALLERELEGVLRAIEFIYKEPGVNRPLKSTDNKTDNQNKTDYRNQVNKVANAIKEIITALKSPVSKISEPTSVTPPLLSNKTKKISGKKIVLAAMGLMILFALSYGVSKLITSAKGGGPELLNKSIAVLPFVNMSNDKDQEYFSDGLSEELLNLLAKVSELKVIARTSAFSFKGKNEDVRIIAEKLGVDHILEGSVRKSGDKIRITVQLIKASDGSHLWSQTYDRKMDDIFQIQDEIAGAVVKELKVSLLGAKNISTPQNTEAYNLFLQGNYFASRRGKENFETALQYYKQALEIDSNYAPAWVGVAGVYSSQADYAFIPTTEGYTKARNAVQHALRSDPLLADAYVALSRIYFVYDWDWEAADTSIKKALELDPSNAFGLRLAGRGALALGRLDEAVTLCKQSMLLDPVQVQAHKNLALVFYYSGRLGEAEQASRKALELNPTYASGYYTLARMQLAQGKAEAALESILKESDESWRSFGLPLVYFKLGRKAESDSSLKELTEKRGEMSAYQIAEAHAFRGEIDFAFKWLERAYEQRDGGLTSTKVDPLLKNLHSDPRWKNFLKKMKLLTGNA